MIVKEYYDDVGVLTVEWSDDTHKFILTLDENPDWIFVSKCSDMVIEDGKLPPKFREMLTSQMNFFDLEGLGE